MENNGFFPVVGYAFVKPQTDFVTYEPKQAMERGTLFPEIDLPMCEYLKGIKEDKCRGR